MFHCCLKTFLFSLIAAMPAIYQVPSMGIYHVCSWCLAEPEHRAHCCEVSKGHSQLRACSSTCSCLYTPSSATISSRLTLPPTLKVSHRSLKAPPSLSKSLKVSQFDLGFVGVTFLFVFGALFGGKNSEPFWTPSAMPNQQDYYHPIVKKKDEL